MKPAPEKSRSSPLRKRLAALAVAAVVTALSGCRTLTFYGQAAKGQYALLAHGQRIQKLLADPQTPGPLRERLRLLLDLRVFAEQKLKLPVNGHYQRYVDVHRPFVVWNVEAAPEFSLQPKTWWYPLVGSLEYRGYFSERGAGNYGSWLEKKGCDVYLGGVQAYSTLGWFKDPVLSTFIFEPDGDLAEVIFHELGHQRVFARGDTDFNEAFATTVGQEGARRWLRAQGLTTQYEAYQAELRRTAQFARLIMDTRAQLATLYGDERNEWGKLKATNQKRQVPRQELRREKQRILDRLRGAYSGLKAQWGGDTEYDAWFSRQLNNAKLNSVAAYYDLVPGFQQLLKIDGGDLEKFYQGAERLSKMPEKQRHHLLRLLAQASPTLSLPLSSRLETCATQSREPGAALRLSNTRLAIAHGLTEDLAGYPEKLGLAVEGQLQGGGAAARLAGDLNLRTAGWLVGAHQAGIERAGVGQVGRLVGRGRAADHNRGRAPEPAERQDVHEHAPLAVHAGRQRDG